jgi:signal transduction histidine kinase
VRAPSHRHPRGTLSESTRSRPESRSSPPPDPLAIRADRLDLLERLSDSLAHEIKNPLHSMVINLEVLKRRLARLGADGTETLHYAVVLGEELERVSRRVELLLRLSRPERGGSEDATLVEIVEEVMELVHLEARQRDAHVRFSMEGLPGRVGLGRQAARQMVLDLILDALEEVRDGDGVDVHVAGDSSRAELRVEGGATVAGPRLEIARALAESAGGTVLHEAGSRSLRLPVLEVI